MKNPTLLILLTLLFSYTSLFSQEHQSKNNYSGTWSSQASWQAGDGNLVSGDSTEIFGFIVHNGDLSLNQDRDMVIYDTLIVKGNLTLYSSFFGPYTELKIHPGGILIVLGDLLGTHSNSPIEGDIVVTGEVKLENLVENPLSGDGGVYFFDPDPEFKPGNTVPILGEADLPLYLLDLMNYADCIDSDNTPPDLVCEENISVCAETATGTIISDLSPSSLTDDCSDPSALSLSYEITGATSASGTGVASNLNFNIGNSDLTYTAWDLSGNETTCTIEISVNNLPAANTITGNANPACNGTGINYAVESTANSKFYWSVPEGATIQTDTSGTGVNSIDVNFGAYNGTIDVLEVSEYGCSGDTATLEIQLQGCDLNAEISFNKDTLCLTDSLTVWSNSTGVTPDTEYQWNFGPEAIPSTATGLGPHSIKFLTAGAKTIHLITTDGASDTASLPVEVVGMPSLDLVTNDRCGPGEVLFTAATDIGVLVEFSDNNGNSIGETDNTEPFEWTRNIAVGDTAEVIARVYTAKNICVSDWSAPVRATALAIPETGPIQAESTNDQDFLEIVCMGSTHTYTVDDSQTDSYRWELYGTTFMDTTGSNSISIEWNYGSGEYTLVAQKLVENGCPGSESSGIILISSAEPVLPQGQSICEGESYLFETVESYTSYLWHDNSTEPDFLATEEGTISVTVTNEYGCTGSAETSLELYSLPQPYLGNDTILCDEAGYTLDVPGYMYYEWSNGANTSQTTVYPGDGLISLTVTDENMCSGSDEITIIDCPSEEIFSGIPNVFTPNGDGVHEEWIIPGIELYPNADIVVFDRTGRVVFEVNGGYDNSWRGDLNGDPLPMDTYYYVIDFNSPDAESVKGTVTIVLD